MRLSGELRRTALIGCALMLCQGSVSARDQAGLTTAASTPGAAIFQPDSFRVSDADWPLWYGVQQTGLVNACFNAIGQFGREEYESWWPNYDFWPKVSFESPPGSRAEYLYCGALWVGGIVGADTLVSVGWDGWQLANELYPPAGPNGGTAGSVTYFEGPADFSMRAVYTDTINAGIAYRRDVIENRPHRPLHISIATRSYALYAPPLDKGLLYDLVITNIGQDYIHDGYVGFYFDVDVGNNSDYNAAFGDVTGALAEDSIGYALDADADWGATVPVRKAIAFKLLRSSFPVAKASYNWWASNGNPEFDWGPRLKTDTRDLLTGGQGTPEGDRNKYSYLSNGEWDFDQIFSAAISSDSSIWRMPDASLARYISQGNDTRFLYSVGPFDLASDSSVRLIFTTFVDSVHVDPSNKYEHLSDFSYDPAQYLASLTFDGMRRTAMAFDSAADRLLDPNLAPTGLHVRSISPESLLVSWDPWAFPDVQGYNIYFDSVPRSAYAHEGVVPIWYHPPATSLLTQVDGKTQYILGSPDPYTAFACCVSHRTQNGEGALSDPVMMKWPTPLATPRWTDSLLFLRGDVPATLHWRSVEGSIKRYNIYKFVDSIAAKQTYSRHYSLSRLANVVDSVWANDRWYYYYALPVSASVPSTETTWVDLSPLDGAVYLLTAVDTAGFETPFSDRILTYKVAEQTGDVLLMTRSTLPMYNYVQNDSIEAFYRRVLAGYRYDMYSVTDTFAQCAEAVPACLDWRDFVRYKTIIVDDGLRDYILRDWYENSQGGFGKYLLSGGKLIYFGAFSVAGQTQFSQATAPDWYARNNSFARNFFGIDSVFYMGMAYYKTVCQPPLLDTIVGFARAGSLGELPSLSFDTTRFPFSSYVAATWPQGTAPDVAVFQHDTTATDTHLLLSRYPLQSRIEGLPIGLHKQWSGFETYLFGFHLWYMEEAKARGLLRQLLAGIPVDVTDNSPTSYRTVLGQNYPNPFNPTTTIRFELARGSDVRLEIFNVLGQRVRTLVETYLTAGPQEVTWQGTDEAGHAVASGIYLYRLTAGNAILTRKMLLLK